DHWIVQLSSEASRNAVTLESLSEILSTETLQLRVLRGLGREGLVLAASLKGNDDEVRAALTLNDDIIHFSRDRTLTVQSDEALQVFPDDGLFDEQWALHNAGPDVSRPLATADADIDYPEAQALLNTVPEGELADDVVVAVLDTGVDLTHPDLVNQIWMNPGESGLDENGIDKSTNGIDDDNNGFVDDVHGWDFVTDSPVITDPSGHGTFVAGTIAAEVNNATGIAGVAGNALILPLRILDENEVGQVSDAIQALNYARMLATRSENTANVRVTNNSYIDDSSDAFDQAFFNAIQDNLEANILFVAAAGNGSLFHGVKDLDRNPVYPAAYALDNVLTVASSDDRDSLAGFSNFGRTTVHLSAPGVDIVSTIPDAQSQIPGDRTDDYDRRSGTSFATPHVSGVAALIWSLVPDAQYDEVQTAILRGVDRNDVLVNQLVSGGRLNAFQALQQDTFSPRVQIQNGDISDITGGGGTTQTFTVTITDDSGIDPDTIDGDDVIVTRRGGSFSATAALTGASVTADGRELQATYRITAPGGRWASSDSATYDITVLANSINDFSLNAADAGVIGSFEVAIAPFPTSLVVEPQVVDEPAADGADVLPGDGVAADSQGRNTLRAAIMEANAVEATTRIDLAAGTYTLSVGGTGENSAARGDLDITRDLTIRGAGQATTVINAAQIDRVFHVLPGVTLTLENLTVTGGAATGADDGGGIFNAGTLNLNNVTVTNNTASGEFGDGGGIYSDTAAAIDANNITIENNTARRIGGGIFSAGALSITASGNSPGILAGNQAALGGGLFQRSSVGQTATLTDLLVLNNRADSGGGIYNSGSLILDESSLRNNSASILGGGLFHLSGNLQIDQSVFDANTSASHGGGLHTFAADVVINESTFSRNSAGSMAAPGPADGGAMLVFDSTVQLTNSTVSGNTATGSGGGIQQRSGSLDVISTTIALNAADDSGGGIASSASTTLLNSIIATNSSPSAPDITVSGSLESSGGNIIGNGTALTVNQRIDDLIGTPEALIDPRLAALADNGGPTETHALLGDSPALDFAVAPVSPTDQRNEIRRDGNSDGTISADAGSFEFGETSTTVTTTTDTLSPGSLREAIIRATQISEIDTIILPAGRYELTRTSGSVDSDHGDFDITTDITIIGAGADLTTIDGNDLDRLFEVHPGASLHILGVTLEAGMTSDDGGAILNHGTLTVTDTHVTDSSARSGGGIYNRNNGNVSIVNSTLSASTASENGGAISNESGTVTLVNSTVSGNAASSDGGGLWSSSQMTLSSVTVTANTATGSGGGVYSNASLSLLN
ncbi:unnamed protein product, partial [Discosporangium mesarthrocarpum]